MSFWTTSNLTYQHSLTTAPSALPSVAAGSWQARYLTISRFEAVRTRIWLGYSAVRSGAFEAETQHWKLSCSGAFASRASP